MAAPIAHLDEDWSSGSEFSPLQRLVVPQKGHTVPLTEELRLEDELPDESLSPGEHGAFRSMEDLVKDFDEKLTTCFQNYNTKTENIASESVPTLPSEERDAIWTAFTRSQRQAMPVDKKQCAACSLHTPAFIQDRTSQNYVSLEVSDDEELRDIKSMITTSITEEPLQTADQVIEEIEEMMQDSLRNPSQSDLSALSVDQRIPSPNYEQKIRSMTVVELLERREQSQSTINLLSEALVQHLALRDELDFEKEVKNSFISALIDVQNRLKEHREILRKKRKQKAATGTSHSQNGKTLGARFSMEGLSSVIQNSFKTFRGGSSEKQYLTTVIPYSKTGHPPSIEDLQMITKILLAMRDDSDKVPSLLTDYILKVLV